jgi:thiol-disulfide isomerase/thioredoxin
VSGTIIPLSGDWGTMTGTFENGQLTLSRFDGINAYLFKARLNPSGALEGLLNSERKAVAERAGRASESSLPALPDPNTHTTVKNSKEPFTFSFPDLDGQVVSSTDERFRNKAVIVTITGSWCPNCHDEAPVLNDLYARYHGRGLEVVGLAFEYTGNYERDREQVKVFARRHKIQYPMLLAGTTDEGDLQKKLPQLVNFAAYPTTIFIGRDGLVKKIHAGFEGPATGERFTRLKAEMEELVKELLEGTGG